LPAVEDEVAGVGRLAGLAVNAALQFQVVGIDLLGGYHVRTQGGELVGRFADQPLAAGFQLQIARGEIVAGTVAGHTGERISLADVPGFLADDDHQLDFVVELPGYFHGQLDGPVVAIERDVEFAEEHRRLRNGRANLLGVPAVVQADANDLLRPSHQRGVFDAFFLDESAVGRAGFHGRVDQGIQAGAVFVLEQVVHGCRGMQVEQTGSFGNVQDALLGLDAQPVLAVAAHVQQREAARHAARMRRALRTAFCVSHGQSP